MNNEFKTLIEEYNKKDRELAKLQNTIEEKIVEFLESMLGKYIVLKVDSGAVYADFSNRGWVSKNLKRKYINKHDYYVYIGYADYKVWQRLDDSDEITEDGIFFGDKLYFVRGHYGIRDDYGLFLMSYHITEKSKTLIEDDPIFSLSYLSKDLTEGTFFAFDTEDEVKLFMEVLEE